MSGIDANNNHQLLEEIAVFIDSVPEDYPAPADWDNIKDLKQKAVEAIKKITEFTYPANAKGRCLSSLTKD